MFFSEESGKLIDMAKKFNSLVVLNGGLGNQLFQLSRGLAENEAHQIFINDTIGFPRKQINDNADILAYRLEDIGELSQFKKFAKFNSIINRALLHFVVSPDTLFKKSAVITLFKYFSVINRNVLPGRWKLILGSGAGWSESHPKENNLVFIGYFQSWRWPSIPQVKHKMMKLAPKKPSENFKKLLQEMKDKSIVVVHRRVGDYLQDQTFGVLPVSYYQKGISKALESCKVDEIWLFTDSPQLEFRYHLEEDFKIRIRQVPNDLSPAETLELMRYGTAFVIANSSFSWWGAFLSHTKDPCVIAPAKWFKDMNDPQDICPPNWDRITSW